MKPAMPRGDPNARPTNAYAVLPSAPEGAPSYTGPPARGRLANASREHSRLPTGLGWALGGAPLNLFVFVLL